MIYCLIVWFVGNGMKGTIPNISATDSKLVNISISYNQFTGTIPYSLQVKRFEYLDLSNNHLDGTITSFNDNEYLTNPSTQRNVTLYLNSNRLSGPIPKVLQYVSNINILQGNIFSCGTPLPAHDPNISVYSCGSKTFNDSLITFTVLVVFIYMILRMKIIVRGIQSNIKACRRYLLPQTDDSVGNPDPLRPHDRETENPILKELSTSAGVQIVQTVSDPIAIDSVNDENKFDTIIDEQVVDQSPEQSTTSPRTISKDSYIKKLQTYLRNRIIRSYEFCSNGCDSVWEHYSVTSSYAQENPYNELSLYITNLRLLANTIIILTVIIVIFGGILYAGLKSRYASVSYQYGWVVTSAFMEGDVPAILLLVFYICLMLFMTRLFLSHREASRQISKDYFTEDERFHPPTPDELMESPANDASNKVSMPSFQWQSSGNIFSGHHLSQVSNNRSTQNPLNPPSSIKCSPSSSSHGSMQINPSKSFNPSLAIVEENISEGNDESEATASSISFKDRCSGIISRQIMLCNTMRRSKQFKKLSAFVVYSFVILVNITIVSTVNIVYALLYINSTKPYTLAAYRVFLSAFQVLWGSSVVPNVLTYITSEAAYRPQRQCLYSTGIFIFNTIAIPCIAGSISLDYCFESLFIKANEATSTYSWISYSIVLVLNQRIPIKRVITQTSQFSPPFVYSGQCNSGILVAYIPVFIIS